MLKFINKDKKGNVIKYPDLEIVKQFFKDSGYSEQGAINAYSYYSELGWKDKEGKIVVNWKNQMRNNWFTDKHKIKVIEHDPIFGIR